MLSHEILFVSIQRTGLEQDRVGDPDLADVVEGRCVADRLGKVAREPELLREQRCHSTYASCVLAGGVIAKLGYERQAIEHLPTGLLEVACALDHPFLEHSVLMLELELQVARLEQVAHPQQNLGVVKRLAEEVTGPERQRPAA